MKKFFEKKFLLVLTIAMIFCACKKDNPTPAKSRSVKFEITGNYTGHILVAYTDNITGTRTLTVTSLPWTKESTFSAETLGVGLGGNTLSANTGMPGQTVTVKIYSAGSVVRTNTAAADENGLIDLGTLTYMFP